MKTKKRIFPLLLIMFLLLSSISFLSNQVSASDWEEWEECVYCGHQRSADWLCDCGGCNEESYDCYSEHHCYDCGACEMDISMCDDCKRCVDCVGIMCMDCGQCEECAGRICDDCQKCSDHWTLDLYCEGCDKCCDCFGGGYCFECELCGDCTNLCSNDDCSLCETCTGQVCTECGQCAFCAYDLFCEYCGSCGECSGLMCPHCTLCDDCVTVCKGCENGCSDCRDICMTCEECEDCVEILCPECNECIGCSGATICIGCDLCSNCVNMCEDCGEVCSDCEDFCQECNLCTKCLPEELCNGCGDYCLGCKEYCTECSCCEECANLCDDCEEMCDGCADFCLDCNKCANCVDLCENCQEYCSDCMETCGNCGWCSECTHICQDCGEVCENCEPFCQGCNTGACCAYICPNCGEFCTECQSDWTYKSLDNIQHQWQCSCGAPLEEPQSHRFIYKVRKAATATEAGFGELKCDLCNYKERVAIPATGSEEHSHNFSFWVSNNKFHVKYCPCGEEDVSTKGDHEFQWVTDIEATIGATGLKHQECDVCGYQLPEEIIPPITTYEVTVNSGTGSGNFAEGATVSITANAPATGKVFDKWTTADGVTFGDANKATTTFVMPAKAVSVTATYKDISSETPDYKIIAGENGIWKKGNTKGIVIISNGDYGDFTGVNVDDIFIDPSNYTSAAGSTVVTLKPTYLETLAVGTHIVTLQFGNYSVQTNLTILAADERPDESKPDESKPDESKPDESKPDESKPDESKPDESKPDESKPDESKPDESKPDESKPDESKPNEEIPKTGESNHTLPLIGLLLLSGSALIGVTRNKKKKKNYNK